MIFVYQKRNDITDHLTMAPLWSRIPEQRFLKRRLMRSNGCRTRGKDCNRSYTGRDDEVVEANFNDYQLSSELLKAIGRLDFTSPTTVQTQVIPAVMKQRDIIVKK